MNGKIIVGFIFSFNILMAIILAQQGVNLNGEGVILGVLSLAIIINGLLSGVLFYKISTVQKKDELNKKIHELEKLNSELRVKNHDALNHFQIVSGLIELDEHEEVKKYICSLHKGLMKLNDLNKSNCIPLNALLLNEYERITECGIELNYLIDSNLDKVPLEDFELCEIVKDVLDKNVFLLRQNTENPQINFKIEENDGYIILKFESNGSEVPIGLRERYPNLSKYSDEMQVLSFAKVKNILYRINCKVRFYKSGEFNGVEVCLIKN